MSSSSNRKSKGASGRKAADRSGSSAVVGLVKSILHSQAFRTAFGTVKSLAIALAGALIIKYSVIEAYNVPTGSMEDTILVGDFLLANKFIYNINLPLIGVSFPGLRDPKPGDIVVFKFPGDSSTNYVKRCIAVGGQVIEVRDKKVFVDGVEFKEYPFGKHLDPNLDKRRDNFGPYKVPPATYFMMGDNRDDSYDSRFWGPVPQRFILGKALVVHWSWGPPPTNNYPRWDWVNPLTWPQNLWYNMIHFHQRVRWERLGQALT
jgi:signal peptidase I